MQLDNRLEINLFCPFEPVLFLCIYKTIIVMGWLKHELYNYQLFLSIISHSLEFLFWNWEKFVRNELKSWSLSRDSKSSSRFKEKNTYKKKKFKNICYKTPKIAITAELQLNMNLIVSLICCGVDSTLFYLLGSGIIW